VLAGTAVSGAVVEPGTARTGASTPVKCGDGRLEGDETCATWPADCAPTPCRSTGQQRRLAVVLRPQQGFERVGAVTILVGYGAARLTLPGSGSGTALRGRVRATQKDSTVAVNDLGGRLRVLVTRPAGLTAETILEIALDQCEGAQRSTADIACSVETCAWGGSPLTGCSCSIRSL
jgi:hypothetical protein